LQGFEAGDDGFGVETGAGGRAVRLIVREERGDGGLAEGVEAAGEDGVEIDEWDALLDGDGASPAGNGLWGLAEVAVLPLIVGNGGAEDGGGAVGEGVDGDLTEVPAEGVDELGLVGGGVGEIAEVVVDTGETAFHGGGGIGVVAGELDEDDIAGFDEGEGVGPEAFGDIGTGGAAGDGSIDDIDLGAIEEGGEGIAPALAAGGGATRAGADGGVADEEEGAKDRIGGEW